MLKKTIILSCLTLVSSMTFSQSDKKYFDEIYRNSYGSITDQNVLDFELDEDNNVFVLSQNGSGTDFGVFLNKITPEGNVEWTNLCSSANNLNVGKDLELDENGYPFILFEENTSTSHQSVISKYNPNGTLIWTNNTLNSLNKYSQIHLHSNKVYVGGESATLNTVVMSSLSQPLGSIQTNFTQPQDNLEDKLIDFVFQNGNIHALINKEQNGGEL